MAQMVELRSVELLDASFTDMALAAHLTVRNPTARPRTAGKYEWTLAFDGAPVLQGRYDRQHEIAPGEERHVRIPIAFHFAELFARAPALRGRDAVSYRLTLRAPRAAVPLEYRGVLQFPQAPTVRLAGVRVHRISWREATVQIDVALLPRSAALLELRSVRCALTLDGRPILHAEARELALPLEGEVRVPMTVRVPLGPNAQATAAILHRRDASFHLTGHAALQTPAFGVLRLPIDQAGVIALAAPTR